MEDMELFSCESLCQECYFKTKDRVFHISTPDSLKQKKQTKGTYSFLIGTTLIVRRSQTLLRRATVFIL